MKKNILNALTVIFLIAAFGYFMTSAGADMDSNEEDAAFNGCCVSFILMCVFAVWAKKVQDAEKLEENLLMAENMQKAESERLKLESERLRLAQEAEQNRIESAKKAERVRLRKEIEELEKGLDE